MTTIELAVTEEVAVAEVLGFIRAAVLLDALEPRLVAVVVALLWSRTSDITGLRGDDGGGGQREDAGGREKEGVELHDCGSIERRL